MRNLIKIGIAILLHVFILSGCEKETDELPPSLRAEVAKITDCGCMPYIAKYLWRGETVYFRGLRGPACNGVPLYYNRDGLKITMEAGYTFSKFTEEAILIKSVWEGK